LGTQWARSPVDSRTRACRQTVHDGRSGIRDSETCRILLEASRHLDTRPVETTEVTDSGTENVNGNVDALLEREGWKRILAQVEASFSNSIIEASGDR
jgi:hypothetical protein